MYCTDTNDDWLKEIDNKKIVGAVLLDFSAAFDIIDLLLRKCMCYCFKTSAISWIKSYLSKITQGVFFNGSVSNVKQVKCGILQGSSLGPLLFIFIFTDDLPLALNKAMFPCMLMIQPYTQQQLQLMKSLKHLTQNCSLSWNGWPVIHWS